MRWFFTVVVICACLLLPDELLSQDEIEPGRLTKEIRSTLQPGLLVEYFSSKGELLDSDVLRLPALFVNESEPLSPLIAGRQVTVRMAGFLKLKLKGAYRFSAVGNGKLQLTVNGTTILQQQADLGLAPPKELELVKGYNFFELNYVPPSTGAAQLRIYWENEDFTREPIPAGILLHSPEISRSQISALKTSPWDVHQQRHWGRDLVLRHNCLKCHQSQDVHQIYQQRDTPDLKIAAQRLNQPWLEDWLRDPAKMRNSISMPQVFDPEKDVQSIGDLAAFLMSLARSESTSTSNGDAGKGGDLFENIGCIGCHHFEEPGFEDEYERISLHYTRAKFRIGRLAEFLTDSRKHYQWSRMPKFRLTPQQAEDLEAYIRSESQGKAAGVSVDQKDGQRGKKIFAEAGCANCHSGVIDQVELQANLLPSLADLKPGSGCLAESTPKSKTNQPVPDFRLSKTDKQALNQLVESGDSQTFSHFNPAYFTLRQIRELRCATCHDLDDEQATLPYIIEEEGAVGLPPNRVPMLSYAGEKLLPNWSEKLISGELPYRVREHFRVQMPGFPVRGKAIAQGLSQMHGFQRDENTPWKPDTAQIAKGKQVAAMETGLSCNRCHAIGDKKPNAAFDAQSTNLVFASQRLRKEYYLRWMFDPLRIDKQTKMPRFSEDRKTTSLKSVDDGDAARQFEALWQYLNSIRSGR